MNTDITARMGFFISNLDQRMKELHLKPFDGHSTDEKFTVDLLLMLQQILT